MTRLKIPNSWNDAMESLSRASVYPGMEEVSGIAQLAAGTTANGLCWISGKKALCSVAREK
eukprot:90074-Rhodomonas_salina.3